MKLIKEISDFKIGKYYKLMNREDKTQWNVEKLTHIDERYQGRFITISGTKWHIGAIGWLTLPIEQLLVYELTDEEVFAELI